MKLRLAALLVLWLGAPALAQSTEAGATGQTGASDMANEAGSDAATPEAAFVACEGKPPGTQTCYSAARCSGNKLNNKDEHNCKQSGGKSWCSHDGICSNHI